MMYRVTADGDRRTVLSAIDTVATEFGISWFICGAYSRILLCEKVLKTSTGRATYDLDIAICVRSLNEYTRFGDILCQEHMFEPDSKRDHRLIHRSSGILIDIIPFGKFAEPDELYNWGTDDAFEMNVRGFDDAADLAYFLVNAIHSVSEKDIYGKFDSVLQETRYDIELASCFALGSRIRSVFSKKTVRKIIEILGSELEARENSALISDMYGRFNSWQQPGEHISEVIDQVLKGLSSVGDSPVLAQ